MLPQIPQERPADSPAMTEREVLVDDAYDVAVDFMDATNDLHFWVRPVDVRSGLEVSVGLHVVVGDVDAGPRVARVVAIDADGNLELQILRGSVDSHRVLLVRV